MLVKHINACLNIVATMTVQCVSVCLHPLVQTITLTLKQIHNLSQLFFIYNMYTMAFH